MDKMKHCNWRWLKRFVWALFFGGLLIGQIGFAQDSTKAAPKVENAASQTDSVKVSSVISSDGEITLGDILIKAVVEKTPGCDYAQTGRSRAEQQRIC